MLHKIFLVACMLTAAAAVTEAAQGTEQAAPPSVFGVDAPELAHLGESAVGVRTLDLVQHDQADVLSFDPTTGTSPLRDRKLTVDLWYPARPKSDAVRAVYTATFPSEAPGVPLSFAVTGIAVRDAAAAGTGYPLIIVSHGYRNDPQAMTWLTENLASKGYVVAAIHHYDSPVRGAINFAQAVLRRPLDIVFVAQSLRDLLGREGLVDVSRVALIGYSMGGYGVLTAAGAALDPKGPPARQVPGGLMLPFVEGAPSQDSVKVQGIRAAVAISPYSGKPFFPWGTSGVLGLKTPLLIISGDQDRSADYVTGARAIFDTAVHAPRVLLTFKYAGHFIGLNPPPASMQARLYNLDWFEDPVWRAERVNAIEMHFITAFLDRYVKGDESRASYLDVAVAESSAGVWPAPQTGPSPAYDAYSPGAGAVTVWKGFQRDHDSGLELLHAAPAAN